MPVEYYAIPLETDSVLFPNVNGRFKIIINYESDKREHCISCIIDGIDYSKIETGPESGERLEAQSFYYSGIKLTIGIEGDSNYLAGKRFSDCGYDYDCSYLKNGIRYDILPMTKSQEFVFGIAWVKNCTEVNDVQTWLAADPTAF
jgi:hypothetical protein